MGITRSSGDSEATPPYSVLAVGYDVVMAHVDYELWADYINDVLALHLPDAETVLELGCGTGSFALTFAPRGPYQYLATDQSNMMLKVARRKAQTERADVHFALADFTNFRVDRPADVLLLLYDGLNYLLDKGPLRDLLGCAWRAVRPGGVFIVDQSTPSNSVNNERLFEDSDQMEDFSYVRRSKYDPATRLHRTTLTLTVGERTFVEEHVQRAYEIDDVRPLIDEVGFEVEACYDGFTTAPATEESERAHWVLRRPLDS